MRDAPAPKFERKAITEDQSGFFHAVIGGIQGANKSFPDLPVDEVLAIVGQVAGALAAQLPEASRENARAVVLFNLNNSFERNASSLVGYTEADLVDRAPILPSGVVRDQEEENAAPAEA